MKQKSKTPVRVAITGAAGQIGYQLAFRIELGDAGAADYLARASLYQRLDCPNAERFDLERALLLSDDPIQRLRLTERLSHLPPNSVVH